MSDASREQRLVFGEVAELYDARRPSYPGELFDLVCEKGALREGDRALEVGAGTGKATSGFLARGLDIVALEPSAEMGAVLARTGVRVLHTSFEDWPLEESAFRLVYAAQSWHWVARGRRCEKAAAALAPGGVVALFWNKAREFDGALGAEVDAVYQEHAPELALPERRNWNLESNREELLATPGLTDVEQRVVTWRQWYTTDEYMGLQDTHSDHRMLPDEQRRQLHDGVRAVIDAHGGRAEVVYDTEVFLARRA